MLRPNLSPTLGQAARAVTQQRQAPAVGLSSASVPADGDIRLMAETAVTVEAGDGQASEETHVTAEQAGSLRDTVTRVEQVESAVKNLSAGVSTQGRWNTVSTSDAPSTADGFPEGAWWTKITAADDFTPVALWTVEDGQWVTKPLPAGQTVAPVMNTGLISAGAVAAAIIQSDEFWTAMSGRRVGFNSAGFQSYDADGAQTVRLDGQDNYISGRGELGGWAFKTENGTSVIARADYGDISVSESGIPQQQIPHLETSPARGTVLTHKSTNSTPYLALKDDTGAVIANGDEADKYAQVSSAVGDGTVIAAQLAMRSSTEYASVQSNVQPDTTTAMGAVTKVNAGGTQRAFYSAQIDSDGPSASLVAGDQAVTSGYTGFWIRPSRIQALGPLSVGGNGATVRLMKISVNRTINSGSGHSTSFNIGVPARSDCRYWPISVLPVESGGTADYVCKIQQFTPNTGAGQLYIQKVSGGASTYTDFIIVFVMLKSSDWTWANN